MATAKMRTEQRVLVGQILIKEGVITEEQLERALRVQALLEQPRQLGDVLADLGYATRKSISEAIAKHGRGMRLGDLLVAQGLITPEALEAALSLQREKGIRLGEALIELGHVNERILLRNLAHQAGIDFIEPDFAMVDPTVVSGVSPDYLERFNFVPFCRHEHGKVTVIVPDLEDADRAQAIDELYKGQSVLALGPGEAIRRTINDFRQQKEEDRQARPDSGAASDSVVSLVEHILVRAFHERASDIHIEPLSDRVRVRYRIDGVLAYRTDLPKDLLPRVISRLKILAECNIAERQRHQGGRIVMQHNGRDYDIRISIYVTVHGECAVMRVLNKQLGLIPLDELGMNLSMLERYCRDVLETPSGIVLVTGPTGSGKTTTLYSSVEHVNDAGVKIITAEDPVEYMVDGIIQCSIYDKAGRTFDATLREIVRQDPDVVVLGEIRDQKSAQVAIQAALTGHKVLSTFHTEDTIGALLRLTDMDIETFLVASTLAGVLAQRLLRRICAHCAGPWPPSARDMHRLGVDAREAREYEFMRGRGCPECSHTGFAGRIGVYELLVLDDVVREAVMRRRPGHEIRQLSLEGGNLVTMREDGVAKAVRGYTTLEEVASQTPATRETRPLRQILALTQ